MAGEYSGLISNGRGYSSRVPNYNDGAPYAVPASIQGANEKAHEAASSHYDLMNSNSDEATNGRYQELSQRLKEVESEISQLEQEIARQKTLKSLEISKDPYWELAKERYIRTGDMGELNNIMNRKMTRDMMEAQKGASEQERSDALEENAKRAIAKYRYAKSAALKSDNAETNRALNDAMIDLEYALKKAGRSSEYDAIINGKPPSSNASDTEETVEETEAAGKKDNIINQSNRENEFKAILDDTSLTAAQLEEQASVLLDSWEDIGTETKEAAKLKLDRAINDKYKKELDAYTAKKKAYDASLKSYNEAVRLAKEFNEGSRTIQGKFFNNNTKASSLIEIVNGMAVPKVKVGTKPSPPKKPKGVK